LCECMNVLSINDYDLANRRFNGYDIKDRLKGLDVESRFMVWKKRSDDPEVKQIGWGFHMTALRFSLKMFERCLGIQNVIHPFVLKILIDRWYQETDIVHFHLIHNELLSMLAIPKICRDKKVVWTVHDPWLVTGHCIYPLDCQEWRTGCRECLRLHSPKVTYLDMSRQMWDLKRKIVQGSDIHFVVASKWMRDILQESPVTSGKDITIIPFGIDITRYGRRDKTEARRVLGISDGSIVIAFRSVMGPYKGSQYVIDAIEGMDAKKELTILIFGRKGPAHELAKRYKVNEFGWATEEELELIMAAADIFVMPSLAEAFGMMAIESLASGVPVIAFKGTALGEIIDDGYTGILVNQGDVDGLRCAIETMVSDHRMRERMGENGRRISKERYDIKRQARETAELYRRIMVGQRR
jgi:glycosyltransferase involved in cell wall biosynthesis